MMGALKFLTSFLVVIFYFLPQTSAKAPFVDERSSLKISDPVRYGHYFGNRKTSSQVYEDTQNAPHVNVEGLGLIKGRVLNSSLQHRPFYAFHSIRYAQQPERFQYAEVFDGPLTADGSVYDATRFRDVCPQKSLVAPVITGSEDCLYVSVYCPSENFTEPLPVMVFIHGGAYISGEAQLYMPTKLLDRNVVVAVLQYRLGTLGFLYSGTESAPGNMGLMDQITALRWVQKYISNWGGDPDLVTVFGQSAGGASTSLLQLSPLVQGGVQGYKQLAHRFVPMSGSGLEYWTIEHDAENSFRKQAAAVGCETDQVTPDDMVACMNSKTLDEIVWGSHQVYTQDHYDGGLGMIGQVPVVQTELIGVLDEDLIVIPEQPQYLLTSGQFLKVPTMTGAVRDEGSLITGIFYEGYLVPHGYYTNDTSFLQNNLFPLIAAAYGIEDATNAVPNAFRLGFMPPQLPLGDWDTMVGGLVDLTGMMSFKSGMWTLVHEMQKSNVASEVADDVHLFVYSFEFEAKESLFDWTFISDPDIPVEGGVSHADDLMYLFDLPSCFEDRCKEMMRRLCILYTNFAKHGDPTPEEESYVTGQWSEFMPKWTHFSIENQNFAVISDNITIHMDFPLRWNYNQNGYNKSTSQKSKQGTSIQSPEQERASMSISTSQAAALIFIVAAACVVLALGAMFVWHKKQMRRRPDAPVVAHNIALEQYVEE